jgi:hypothetical protein
VPESKNDMLFATKVTLLVSAAAMALLSIWKMSESASFYFPQDFKTLYCTAHGVGLAVLFGFTLSAGTARSPGYGLRVFPEMAGSDIVNVGQFSLSALLVATASVAGPIFVNRGLISCRTIATISPYCILACISQYIVARAHGRGVPFIGAAARAAIGP